MSLKERLSYAHAGDHALLENEAARLDMPRLSRWGGISYDEKSREVWRERMEQDQRQHKEQLDKYRLHLRTHLVIYHHTRIEDIADYGHNAASDVPRHLLQRLHEELHSDLIDLETE